MNRLSSEVFGISLNQKLRTELASEEGYVQFKEKIGNGTQSAIAEVEEAYQREAFQNKEEHLALLEYTHALSKSSGSPIALTRLSTETTSYLVPGDHQDLDYGGRAMQYYLNEEKDETKRLELLNSLGIEVIIIEE